LGAGGGGRAYTIELIGRKWDRGDIVEGIGHTIA